MAQNFRALKKRPGHEFLVDQVSIDSEQFIDYTPQNQKLRLQFLCAMVVLGLGLAVSAWQGFSNYIFEKVQNTIETQLKSPMARAGLLLNPSLNPTDQASIRKNPMNFQPIILGAAVQAGQQGLLPHWLYQGYYHGPSGTLLVLKKKHLLLGALPFIEPLYDVVVYWEVLEGSEGGQDKKAQPWVEKRAIFLNAMGWPVSQIYSQTNQIGYKASFQITKSNWPRLTQLLFQL